MSVDLNQVTLTGNMTSDPETREAGPEHTATHFTIAVNSGFKNKEGQEYVEFVDVVAFDKLGKVVQDYQHKGNKVLVTGRLQSRKYQPKDAPEGTTRKVWSVRADKVLFLTPKNGNGNGAAAPAGASDDGADEADVPF